MIKDNLVLINNNGIYLTEDGKDFSQYIANVFDSYDPPHKSATERLEIVKKAKLTQSQIQKDL